MNMLEKVTGNVLGSGYCKSQEGNEFVTLRQLMWWWTKDRNSCESVRWSVLVAAVKKYGTVLSDEWSSWLRFIQWQSSGFPFESMRRDLIIRSCNVKTISKLNAVCIMYRNQSLLPYAVAPTATCPWDKLKPLATDTTSLPETFILLSCVSRSLM